MTIVTTSSSTGLAVAKVLLKPELTANKQVFLSDFVTNVREIVDNLEEQIGEKFSIEEKQSGPVIKELKQRFQAGDFNATYPLLALSFVADVDVGYDFEKEQVVWNDKLELPSQNLEEVVKEAIELVNSTI